MTLGEQSGVVFALTVVLYGAAGIGFLFRGWPFRGGVVMFVISLLLLIWQVALTDSDAPGFGLLFVFMAPLPLLLMAVGSTAALVRALLRLRRRPAG